MKEIKHGTYQGYQNCKCGLCKEANAKYGREYRLRIKDPEKYQEYLNSRINLDGSLRKPDGFGKQVHGTNASFAHCKCDECRTAHNLYNAKRRQRLNPEIVLKGPLKNTRSPGFCSICGIEQTSKNTGKNLSASNGLLSYCKDCVSKQGKETRRKNPVKLFKNDDKRKGLENDLDADFVKEMLDKPCTYCLGHEDLRMTLDRIDNSLGHIKSNVQTSCRRCNYLRGNMPYKAWLELLPGLRRIHKKDLFGDWTPGPTSIKIKKELIHVAS